MPIDPSIPLAANPPPDFLTQQRGIVSLAQMAQQLKQQQAAAQAQNALRQVFANPANLDSSGNPTPNAFNRIMAIDPNTGLQLRQNQLRSEQTRLAIAGSKADLQQKLSEMSQTIIRDPALLAYEEAKKSGLSEQAAQAAGQRAYSDGLQQLKSSGLISDDQLALVPSDFNYLRVKARSLDYKSFLARQSAEKKLELDERKTAATEKRADAFEQSALGRGEQGWQILTDPGNRDAAGNPVQYRYNPRTAQATTLGGEPYTPGGAAKLGSGSGQFTDKMGSLMAALAEQGVALPTGFRSKEQQVQLYKSLLDRNSDKNVDEIARGVKTGQIEFAAQKKETQTAAGIAGKVEVAQNELEEFVPLVRTVSAKVDRTRFVPINKLLQIGESEISDPNLKQLRIYINSTLNAYDVLAARGGTDKDKRAETRALLTSADGPEALEAGLQAFMKEAEAARRAAIKATKVPELPESSVQPGKEKPKEAADIKKQATDAFGSYEPDKYEYGTNPVTGNFARRLK